jgi:luciferase-like monooxygenase
LDAAELDSAFERLRDELLANSRVSSLFMGNPKHAYKDTGFFYEERHFLHFHPQPDGFQADLRVIAGERGELLKDPHVQPHTLNAANETGWLLFNIKTDEDTHAFMTAVRRIFEAAEIRQPAEFRQLQP